MMAFRLPSVHGSISVLGYAVLAPTVLLSQHLLVAALFHRAGAPIVADLSFWLLPMRELISLPQMNPWLSAVFFLFSLIVAWALAVMSYRRAGHSTGGVVLAAVSIIPGLQIISVALLAVLPLRVSEPEELPLPGINLAHVLQGVLAGMAIIVLAVLLSAVTIGSYGWGLFVATPFMVGLTTAYIANRDTLLPDGKTLPVVLLAAALGVLALLMFALEGFMCIVLIAPLGAILALVGGALGRTLAEAGHIRGRPLLGIAVLPLAFIAEAAAPPSLAIATEESVDIAAPPARVWQALTNDAPIAGSPGLVALADFAYPLRGRLLGESVGAVRLGEFSTGIAQERVTQWEPERILAFDVIDQPAMMVEMSPYRRVHAPHLHGYFETDSTRFELQALPSGGTRLTVHAAHKLRIDPALYWEPLARWAIKLNVSRVLSSIKMDAEGL